MGAPGRHMAVLTAILTHLDDELVRGQLDYLRAVAPDARFVVCFGGERPQFDRLTVDEALFVEEPSLRGPPRDRSHTSVLTSVYEQRVRDDPQVEFAYFIEFDHLILRPDFEQKLVALAERTGAGLLGKSASPRNDTNWRHFLRYRDDDRVNAFVARISRRDDVGLRFGCLGSGMLLRREALAEFGSLGDYPHAYVEMLVPTIVHHLGFDVVDVDDHCDLYATVSWRPEFGIEDAIAAKRDGRTFVHPFKRLDALEAIRSA
jgi:hypothetical protein